MSQTLNPYSTPYKSHAVDLTDEMMRKLYEAASEGDLSTIKQLLPSYHKNMRGKLFSERWQEDQQLPFKMYDNIFSGEQGAYMQQASPEKRLRNFKKVSSDIDQYVIENITKNVKQDFIAANSYVDLANEIFDSDMVLNSKDIHFARDLFTKALAIYKRHPNELATLPGIREDGMFPIPSIAEKNLTSDGKRHLQQQNIHKAIQEKTKSIKNDAKARYKLGHTANYYLSQLVLSQPADIKFYEQNIKKIYKDKDKLIGLNWNEEEYQIMINGIKLLEEEDESYKTYDELTYQMPLITKIIEGNTTPVYDYTEEDAHKGEYNQLLKQKNILNYLQEISKDDPVAQLSIAEGLMDLAASLPKDERRYFDTAKLWFNESLSLYQKQAEAYKKTIHGKNVAYSIASYAAEFYEFEHKKFIDDQEIIQLLEQAMTIFPKHPLDKDMLLGAEQGPALLLQNIGRLLIKQGKFEQATQYFEKSLRENIHIVDDNTPSQEDNVQFSNYTSLAYAYSKTGNYSKAIGLIKKLRSYILEKSIAPSQYQNPQLDLSIVIKEQYGTDLKLAKKDYHCDKDEQKKTEEALGNEFKNTINNATLIGKINELIPISRQLIKLHLKAGNIKAANDEYANIHKLVDAIDLQVRKADVQLGSEILTYPRYEILRSSRYFADHGIVPGQNSIVKIGVGDQPKNIKSRVVEQLLNNSYVEKEVDSDQQRHVLRKLYNELWMEKDLQPILTMAALGTQGKFEGHGRMGVVFSQKAIPGTHGFYNNKDIVQISMNPSGLGVGAHHLNKFNIHRIKNTLIHEITHYVTNRQYHNNALPYYQADEAGKKTYRDAVFPSVQRAIEQTKKNQNKLLKDDVDDGQYGSIHHAIFSDIAQGKLLYLKDMVDTEFIVRIPASLSTASRFVRKDGTAATILKQAIPEAYEYFANVFNKDLEETIAKINQRETKAVDAPLFSSKHSPDTQQYSKKIPSLSVAKSAASFFKRLTEEKPQKPDSPVLGRA